ncbi:MAG: ABZJ_00895 family protein [Gammaproteobacteria bacterium]|nr:ABZJ_00895 family protein [Gammaproteobacteria bacterium]
MTAHLKPYIRQFSLYYFLGYLIGLPLLIIIDNIWHLHASDFIIMLSLSMSLPYLICDKFVKNETRFFSEDEQKLFVKKSALIAMLISLVPCIFYSAALLSIKLSAALIIAITLFSALLYYSLIRFSLNSTIKSLRKRYEKKLEI